MQPAVLIPQTTSILTNNIIAENSARTCSGITVAGSHVEMIHNSLLRNLDGAGVHVTQSLSASVALTKV